MSDHTEPSPETRTADVEASHADHAAGRMPTPEEEAAAERAGEPPESVKEAYKHYVETGAHLKGEGQITPDN